MIATMPGVGINDARHSWSYRGQKLGLACIATLASSPGFKRVMMDSWILVESLSQRLIILRLPSLFISFVHTISPFRITFCWILHYTSIQSYHFIFIAHQMIRQRISSHHDFTLLTIITTTTWNNTSLRTFHETYDEKIGTGLAFLLWCIHVHPVAAYYLSISF